MSGRISRPAPSLEHGGVSPPRLGAISAWLRALCTAEQFPTKLLSKGDPMLPSDLEGNAFVDAWAKTAARKERPTEALMSQCVSQNMTFRYLVKQTRMVRPVPLDTARHGPNRLDPNKHDPNPIGTLQWPFIGELMAIIRLINGHQTVN